MHLIDKDYMLLSHTLTKKGGLSRCRSIASLLAQPRNRLQKQIDKSRPLSLLLFLLTRGLLLFLL